MTIIATTNLTAQNTPAATSDTTNSATGTAGTTNPSSTAAGSNAKANDVKNAASTIADSKQQLNLSIVQSALTVSISSQNDPLSLVYKSAIENINEALKPSLGNNAIQEATTQDNSPAGTAGRIVSLSTGLFDLYKRSFPGEDESTVLDRFIKVIKGGVDAGFSEARGMLDGMGVLNGSLSDNINKTYDLVGKGIADFAASRKAQIIAASAATDAATAGKASADAATNTNAKSDTNAA